jgi:hypothetical protein
VALGKRSNAWLKEDKFQKWVKWARKLENIRAEHTGKEPSVEFYTSKIKGIDTTRAKVVWDDVATVKNRYYDGEIKGNIGAASPRRELSFNDLTDSEQREFDKKLDEGQWNAYTIMRYLEGKRRSSHRD